MTAPARTMRRADRSARAFQLIYPAMNRLLLRSPSVEFATRPMLPPTTLTIPTRFGSIDALVWAPPAETVEQARRDGRRLPVHMLLHGGSFILQYPKGEGNIARYLASELGCYVVMPDYRAAPQVQHPVAQLESYDAYRWIRENGADRGWDVDRTTVGGPSAGGHLTLAVALLALDDNYPVPAALSVEIAPVDLSLGPASRQSSKARPIISPRMVQLVTDTYFRGADVNDPLASPIKSTRLGELPPTLILTAEHDTLRPEAERFAARAAAAGATITSVNVDGVDHGFLARPPAHAAKRGAEAIARHLGRAYQQPTH